MVPIKWRYTVEKFDGAIRSAFQVLSRLLNINCFAMAKLLYVGCIAIIVIGGYLIYPLIPIFGFLGFYQSMYVNIRRVRMVEGGKRDYFSHLYWPLRIFFVVMATGFGMATLAGNRESLAFHSSLLFSILFLTIAAAMYFEAACTSEATTS